MKNKPEITSLDINSKILLAALDTVGKVVDSNPIAPALENVLIVMAPDGIRISGNNLKQSITTIIPQGQVGRKEERFLLPHKKTTELLKTLGDSPLNIYYEAEPKPNQRGGIYYACSVTITVAGKKFKLSSEHHSEWPEIPTSTGESITLPAQIIKEALFLCLATASADDLKPSLAGIHFNADRGEIVSCDGNNLTLYQLPYPIETQNFTITKAFAKLIIDSIVPTQEELVLSICDNNAYVITDCTTITSILIAERFVDYLTVLPGELQLIGIIDVKEWMTALSRALIFANTSFAIQSRFQPGKLSIKTEDTDFGNESFQDLEYEGEIDMVIGLQGRILANLLKNLHGKARIEMSTPSRPLYIFPQESQAEELIIMTMPVMLLSNAQAS